MTHFWLLITFSWLNTVSLQHVQTDGFGVDSADQIHYSMPYMSFLNVPSRNKFEHSGEVQSSNDDSQFYHRDDVELRDTVRRRRRDAYGEGDADDALPNVDVDKTVYLTNSEKLPESLFALEEQTKENNYTDDVTLSPIQKRSFSPWGGKRNEPNVEHMWSWKSNVHETGMPKRVRFSPWGGKRSDPHIRGFKGSKIIFSSNLPEIARVISKYHRNNLLNVAGFQIIPTVDKRHRIGVLTLNTKGYDGEMKAPWPYNSYRDSTDPKMYKPGHPYMVVNLKKDGKRKVKFSTWGGKRTASLTGPSWTKGSLLQGLKGSSLKAILLLRHNGDFKEEPIVAL